MAAPFYLTLQKHKLNMNPWKETMNRILFVDDDATQLETLKELLPPLCPGWQMTFVESGSQALQLMQAEALDVVVSDMVMPVMDGANLLNELRSLRPEVVRIIFSAHTDEETALRAAGCAHLYLKKPLDADILINSIKRAADLRRRLNDQKLQQLVGSMRALPSLPATFSRITEELNSHEPTLERIGRLIGEDVAITSKILQLVNSAFFGLSKPVSNPTQAVSLLGINTITSLVLATGIFTQFNPEIVNRFRLDTIFEHSLAVGAMARAIARDQSSTPQVIDDSLMGGMLHDIGKLILAANQPDSFAQIITLAHKQQISALEAEREIIGTTHAEIGAYLLGIWGIPDPIVEAVLFHHQPQGRSHFSPMSAVHIANVLEYEISGTSYAVTPPTLHLPHLAQLKLQAQLDHWKELCLQVIST